jgi:hypothetical protein
MLVLSCVPWIGSGWGILYLSLSTLDNQPVSDSKHCSSAEAMLYVATIVNLIYLCVNSALKFINNRDKFEKALSVFVTDVLIIIIAAFVHLKISNHMKSMCCTGIASLALSSIYARRCWMVGDHSGTVTFFVGFIFVVATTIIASTLSRPSLE